MDRLGKSAKKEQKKKKRSIIYYAKPRPLTQKEIAEEAELETLLFGDADLTEKLGTEEKALSTQEQEDEKVKEEDIKEEEDEEEDTKPRKRKRDEKKELRPVWEDEDDKEIFIKMESRSIRKMRKKENEDFISGQEYEKRLRARFEAVNAGGGPSWAKLPEEEEKDSEEEDEEALLQSTSSLVGERSKKELPQGGVFLTRCRDANHREPSNAVIQSVAFHKNGQLLLTAGFDKTLRLFQIDGKNNPKVQSIFFENTPIHRAFFTPDGKEAIITGRRKWFHVYDVVSGKITNIPGFIGREDKSLEHSYVSPDSKYLAFLASDGNIILASNQTKQWVANLKMVGGIRGLAFSHNTNHVTTTSDEGLVYLWDLRTHRCFHVFEDEGGSKSTSLAIDNNDHYTAIGSDSGVVNVYETASLSKTRRPKPKKALMNFSVAVNLAKFNPDTQILALACRSQKDRLKLVHTPSLTVFSNWPTARTPLGYVSDIDFSPNGGYLAVGNAKGRVLLYRVNSYDSA